MKKEEALNHLRLLHIKENAQLIVDSLKRFDYETYKNDPIIRLGFEKLIQNIGEAAYNLTNPLKEQHPHIEWRKIEGTRHILVHDYFEIEEAVIWLIATIYIPQLLIDIDPIIEAQKPIF